MEALELEFKSFLEELINMLEVTLWLAREKPEATVDNINLLTRFVEKKLKEIT